MDEKTLINFGRKHERILCFGAGGYGRYVAIFMAHHNIEIEAFVISDSQKMNTPRRFLDKDVLYLSELTEEQKKTCGFVLALNECSAEYVKGNMLKQGICHICQVRDTWIQTFHRSICDMIEKKEDDMKDILSQIFVFPAEAKSYLWQRIRDYLIGELSEIGNNEKNSLRLLEQRYANFPRFTQEIIHEVFPWGSIEVADVASFLSTYKEIFINRIYQGGYLASEGSTILDFGANIGLSAMYFAEKNPQAKIEAYEPDPLLFDILKRNIKNNHYENVNLHNLAVWKNDGILDFYAEGGDGGFIDHKHIKEDKTIPIQAIAVEKILSQHEHISFLKMDIEGAEKEIFYNMQPYLKKVDYIFIEYHSRQNEKHNLGQIVSALEKNGFLLHIEPVCSRKQPFLFLENNINNAFQANLFGVKL